MLNMDFDRRVIQDTNWLEWEQSPAKGVWRRKLAREEAERGHATSIVRYEAGASFSAHDHPAGEEILVLDGVFSDHTGDYGAGSYFRNPEGFRHAPFSEEGCTILVKLHQFQDNDSQHLNIDTHQLVWRGSAARGVQRSVLHRFAFEQVEMLRFEEGASLLMPAAMGEEFYVLKGELRDAFGAYPAGTWLRQPAMSGAPRKALGETIVWRKTGHFGMAKRQTVAA